MSVGVTKDYKLKVSNLHASHTLGWSWNWIITLFNFFFFAKHVQICLLKGGALEF
jgi:hypothetical protein